MLTITVTNATSRFNTPVDPVLNQALDMDCSYDVSGAFFSDKMQKGLWDGRKHLYSKITNSFPTGLLNRVKRILEGYNLEYKIEDLRQPIASSEPLACSINPWEWQAEVIKDCLEKKSGIVKLPTGSGKSIVAINLLAKINTDTTIVVGTRDLLYQFKDDIKKCLGIDAGQIGDNVIAPAKITVAMVQTLANSAKIKLSKFDEKDKTNLTSQKIVEIQKLIENTKCLIVDEVHQTGVAPVAFGLQKLWKNAYYKFGLSATPYRTDKADLLLEAAFGERIVDKTCTELIDKGYLAKPTFYLIKFRHSGAAAELSYADVYEREVVNNEDRNFTIVKTVAKFWKSGKTILIIVQHIRHGELLEEMLAAVIGKRHVKFVQGSTETDIRQQTLKDLNTGDIRVVIATKIFAVGVNIPFLNVLMNVKAQISPVDFVQIIGRAMRKTETKDTVTVVDIYDTGCRYLTTHSEERLEILKTEKAFILNMIDSDKI